MEAYHHLKNEAQKKITLADHMLFVTYPLIKDSKLLLAVIENVFLALTSSVAYLLYYERMFKRVPPFFDTFESKYRIFSEKCLEKYGIEESYLEFLRDIKEILLAHKRSPIEFSRKDQFVICSDDYQLKVLNISEIKDYVARAKDFFITIDSIVKRLEKQHDLKEISGDSYE